jgi:predicted nucleic acid-binding protein
MPVYEVEGCSVDVRRDIMLLDTNILVAAFSERDRAHDDAQTFLYEWGQETQFAVTASVIVEAWGLLVGSRGERPSALGLLSWVIDPGALLVLLPERTDSVGQVREVVHEHSATNKIDYVDASLACLADEISEQCGLNPPASIATFDTGHFLLCKHRWRLRYRVFDMQSLEHVE